MPPATKREAERQLAVLQQSQAELEERFKLLQQELVDATKVPMPPAPGVSGACSALASSIASTCCAPVAALKALCAGDSTVAGRPDQPKQSGYSAMALAGDEDEAQRKQVAQHNWESVHTGIFFPCGRLKGAWDMVILCFILYSAVMVPYRSCFNADPEGGMQYFEVTCTLIFLVDVFATFNTVRHHPRPLPHRLTDALAAPALDPQPTPLRPTRPFRPPAGLC